MKRTDLCLKGQNTCLLYQECYYLGSLRPQEAFVRGVTPLVIYNLPLVLETRLQTEPDVASAVSTAVHCNIVEQGSMSTVVWKHVFERGFSKSQLERKQALKLCTDAAFIRSWEKIDSDSSKNYVLLSTSRCNYRVHSEKACSWWQKCFCEEWRRSSGHVF